MCWVHSPLSAKPHVRVGDKGIEGTKGLVGRRHEGYKEGWGIQGVYIRVMGKVGETGLDKRCVPLDQNYIVC
jgi:hypothetical protein